ncbi:MAG: MgtC/SapB family protein [Oscillospiraceae bacterium]|nr:MgtC/SapB family protein [Oscillospiraceae bacterium]
MLELRALTMESIIFRLVAAIILGGVIGFERGRKNRPAGLRTNMLVCIGACIVMLTNQYIYQATGTGDPVRMGAQVVSGIGFLGAGTIIVTSHNRIKGLTTAASLWTAACVGLALGVGLYEVAAVGGMAVFIVLTLLHLWDGRIHRNTRSLDVYIELESDLSLGEFLRRFRESPLSISGLQIEQGTRSAGVSFFATVKSKKKMDHQILLDELRSIEGIRFCETL